MKPKRKAILPEPIAVSACVSHSTLTAVSNPLLRDTVRKTGVPSSWATTSELVLCSKKTKTLFLQITYVWPPHLDIVNWN